jgi:hypothetical protein
MAENNSNNHIARKYMTLIGIMIAISLLLSTLLTSTIFNQRKYPRTNFGVLLTSIIENRN